MKSNPALLASALILSLAALPTSRGECHLIGKELGHARQSLASRVFARGGQPAGTPVLAKATSLTQVLTLRRGQKDPKQQGVG